MSLIEGIGDEVTLLVAIIIIVAVIVVGWMSTRVDATPYTSIVIIDRDRFVELLRRLRGLSAPASNSATSPLTRDGTGTAAVSSNTASSSVAEDTAAVSNNETATVIPNVRQTGARECVENLESVANSDHPTLEPSVDCHQSADAESQAACSDSQLYSQQCTNDEREALLACSQTNDGSSVDTLNSDTDTSVQQSQASYQEVPSAADELASSQVQIRLQYIDGRQKLVLAHPDDTIGHLKRSHFAAELAANSAVRFVASGKELRDETSTLRSLQLGRTGAVIHCLVTPQRASQSVPSSNDAAPTTTGHQFDVGVLVFPLFGTVLIALWYARVVYRGYFNGTSTFSLFAVSFLYVIALVASLRGRGHQEQPTTHAHSD